MPKSETHAEHPLVERLRAFIAEPNFPCVGAKSALARGQLHVTVANSITSAWNDIAIHRALLDFVAHYRRDRTLFQSFAVVFAGPRLLDEATFETHMWARLQSMADKDEWLGQHHDARVSADPENPHFGMSFGGEGFFVVGLHPHASRPARRFEAPVLVFNLRDQFEQLREQGRYEKLRSAIIARDVALAGSPNPMLARHGEVSEARQYSGRAVSEDWRCPFSRAA